MTPISQSCIRTRVKVPMPTVAKFLQSIFPELACDARVIQPYCYDNSIEFVVEHTEQPVVEVGPILLEPPKEEPFIPDEDIPF